MTYLPEELFRENNTLRARIAELEAEVKMARLVFGKAVVRHTNKDPDDLWDALMDEIRARPTP